jgi:hypothetical protein
MRLARRSPLIVLALYALFQTGCVLAAVGAAGAVGGGAAAIGIRRGTVTQTFEASVDDTTVALQSALRDLGLPIERPRGRPNFAEIDSTLPGGGPVLMTVLPDAASAPGDPPRARVEVHVKVFGDKQFSERLLEQVSYRLKNPAPALPPSQSPAPTNPPPPPLAAQTDEPGLAPAAHSKPSRK